MGSSVQVLRFVASVVVIGQLAAQGSLSADDLARADAGIRFAFAALYALPRDTAGAPMGTWVIDTSATTPDGDKSGRWRILVTKLTDTGQELARNEVLRDRGTSPAQLAASIAEMRRLEGKTSKAEADATLDVLITVNDPALVIAGVSDDADRSKAEITGAKLATRIKGDWVRVDDRELDIDYERWAPATLVVGFGAFGPLETRRAAPKESLATFTARARPSAAARAIHTIAITAQGNEEMIDRLIRETRWDALSALIN